LIIIIMEKQKSEKSINKERKEKIEEE
jgi:hypothetical protein